MGLFFCKKFPPKVRHMVTIAVMSALAEACLRQRCLALPDAFDPGTVARLLHPKGQ